MKILGLSVETGRHSSLYSEVVTRDADDEKALGGGREST